MIAYLLIIAIAAILNECWDWQKWPAQENKLLWWLMSCIIADVFFAPDSEDNEKLIGDEKSEVQKCLFMDWFSSRMKVNSLTLISDSNLRVSRRVAKAQPWKRKHSQFFYEKEIRFRHNNTKTQISRQKKQNKASIISVSRKDQHWFLIFMLKNKIWFF